jgi:hypothetical protein
VSDQGLGHNVFQISLVDTQTPGEELNESLPRECRATVTLAASDMQDAAVRKRPGKTLARKVPKKIQEGEHDSFPWLPEAAKAVLIWRSAMVAFAAVRCNRAGIHFPGSLSHHEPPSAICLDAGRWLSFLKAPLSRGLAALFTRFSEFPLRHQYNEHCVECAYRVYVLHFFGQAAGSFPIRPCHRACQNDIASPT